MTHDDEMMKRPTSMFNNLSQVFAKRKSETLIKEKKMINLCKSNKQLPTICHAKKTLMLKQSHKSRYTVFAHKFCPISFVIFLLSLASVCHAGLTCKPSQIFRLPNNLWRRLEILSRKEQKTKF